MAQVTTLEPTWRDWVVTNVQRNCSRESMIASMVEKNFDAEFAALVIREVSAQLDRPGDVASDEFAQRIEALGREIAAKRMSDSVGRPATTVIWGPSTANASAFDGAVGNRFAERNGYVGEATRIPDANVLTVGDQSVRVAVRLKSPEVSVFENVLSADECEELIRRSEVKLARSTTIDKQTGKEIVIENRSSYGTFFLPSEDDFVAGIDRRLSELLRWPVSHGEGLQILRYQVGGEYRPHFDYFPPEEAGSESHLAKGGQRIGTLVMYLNDVEDGGETIFPDIGLSVVPRRGCAVYFGYCNSQGQIDPLTLHGGAPVRRGVKWIATKWLRQHRRA